MEGDHQRVGALAQGELQGLGEPLPVVRRACVELGACALVARAAVAAADDVRGDEAHAADPPAHVLGLLALPLEGERLARGVAAGAERRRGRPEPCTQRTQPLDRIVVSGHPAVAVGPLVVARQQHERMHAAREQRRSALVERVAARLAARLDVADVQHEAQRVGVGRGEHRDEAGLVGLGVGQVADQRECERAARGVGRALAIGRAAGTRPGQGRGERARRHRPERAAACGQRGPSPSSSARRR